MSTNQDLNEIRERADWYPSVRSIDAVPWSQVKLAISDRRYLLAEVDTLRHDLEWHKRRLAELEEVFVKPSREQH